MSRRANRGQLLSRHEREQIAPMNIQDSHPNLQLNVSLVSTGNRAEAVTAAKQITDKRAAAEAWRLLSAANANMQRWDEALADLQIALQHDPKSRPLRLARAQLLGQQGADAAALSELELL